MANESDKPALKITLEDLERVSLNSSVAVAPSPATARERTKNYGNIASPEVAPVIEDQGKSRIFLQGWFYLGVAGMAGALLGWGICEPRFYDAGGHRCTLWQQLWAGSCSRGRHSRDRHCSPDRNGRGSQRNHFRRPRTASARICQLSST